MVERRAYDAEVKGSKPLRSIFILLEFGYFCYKTSWYQPADPVRCVVCKGVSCVLQNTVEQQYLIGVETTL